MLSTKENKNKKSSRLIFLGSILIFASLIIFGLTFYPVVLAEISYQFYKMPDDYVVTTSEEVKEEKNVIKPVDSDFGIVIPKINANAPIVANVDPFNEKEYQQKLAKGIAHAKDTNMFLFAHSAGDFYRASRYNAIFYLIEKLEKSDEIYIFKDGLRYVYQVEDKKIVDPSDISYLDSKEDKRMLTLMTCWPAGTTLKRLLIQAKLISI